ncbi:unnamed protein product [Prorocentrum cordatum]|uniref:Uncharacterized protein n=1 Tax=Prorocentrum cordatum TaxID=2364126 RepID=A0ABN9XGF7_9DINO|nr:unnamed protein product [Polarella glacialis]
MNFQTMRGAAAIEQAARTHDDFELPKRPKGKTVSNSSWLREGLGIDDDTGASDRVATNAAVRGAAGRGKIKILSSLYDEGQWDPWRCRVSIEAADEGGYLLDLLKAFLVHLSWYPSLAEEQEDLVVKELATAPEPCQKALAKSPLRRELTQRTCLLSNLMLVNSPMAARVLEAAAEETFLVERMEAVGPVIQNHVQTGGRDVRTSPPVSGKNLRNQVSQDGFVAWPGVWRQAWHFTDHMIACEFKAVDQTVEAAQGKVDGITLAWDEAQVFVQRLLVQTEQAVAEVYEANFDVAKAEFDGKWKGLEDIARPTFHDPPAEGGSALAAHAWASLGWARIEEMVVFRGDSFEPVRRYPHRKFPATLDTLYVKRFFDLSRPQAPVDAGVRLPSRGAAASAFSLTGCPRSAISGAFFSAALADRMPSASPRKGRDACGKVMTTSALFGREVWHLLLGIGAQAPTPTSVEAEVTLDKELRADFLIPLTAENFCFVYPCAELPWGGYLYIDDDGECVKPIVINQVSHKAGQQAFAFGDPLPLNEENTQIIYNELQDLSPDDPYHDEGAISYAWVMKVPGLDLPLGGFAYVFSDSTLNRVFPLKAVGEVLRMADLPWEVNAHALGMKSNGNELQKYIAPRGERGPGRARGHHADHGAGRAAPHDAARTRVHASGGLDVLATDVAKAISYAAFDRAWPFYLQQFVFDFLSAMILFYIAWEVHRLQHDDGTVQWNFDEWKYWLLPSFL